MFPEGWKYSRNYSRVNSPCWSWDRSSQVACPLETCSNCMLTDTLQQTSIATFLKCTIYCKLSIPVHNFVRAQHNTISSYPIIQTARWLSSMCNRSINLWQHPSPCFLECESEWIKSECHLTAQVRTHSPVAACTISSSANIWNIPVWIVRDMGQSRIIVVCWQRDSWGSVPDRHDQLMRPAKKTLWFALMSLRGPWKLST